MLSIAPLFASFTAPLTPRYVASSVIHRAHVVAVDEETDWGVDNLMDMMNEADGGPAPAEPEPEAPASSDVAE